MNRDQTLDKGLTSSATEQHIKQHFTKYTDMANHYTSSAPRDGMDVILLLLLLLLLVFSPWASLGRDQSSVRRLVWLWYAASWTSS